MKKMLAITLLTISFSFEAMMPVAASGIYKCVYKDKTLFSHTTCPKEFHQYEISYQHGITKEIDSEAKVVDSDPIELLFSNKKTLSLPELIKSVDTEIYRLSQETRYYEILRASEQQKIERERYWQKKDANDPQYILDLERMHLKYDQLTQKNKDIMRLLSNHKQYIINQLASPVATKVNQAPKPSH